jgi:hypothetical protein
MAKDCKGELQNGKNDKTSKTTKLQNTKCQNLKYGERQNVEITERQNIKRQNTVYRTAKYKTAEDPKGRKKQATYIVLYLKTIYFILHGNWLSYIDNTNTKCRNVQKGKIKTAKTTQW